MFVKPFTTLFIVAAAGFVAFAGSATPVVGSIPGDYSVSNGVASYAVPISVVSG